MSIPTKELQGKLWSSSPAHWAKYQEPSFIPLYQHVLDQVPLDEEKRLLDAGCGSGLFLSMALASGVHVYGIDAAPGLLSVAKGRAPGASLLLEDLESLPFIDGTFDVVTGFNSFQYASSFENALAEAGRVVKRHGTVAIGQWGKKEDCPSICILKAVSDLVAVSAAAAMRSLTRSEEGEVESICKTVGLKVRSRKTVLCPLSFNSESELLDGFLCTALCAGMVESLGAEVVKTAIIRQAKSFQLAGDVYYLKNHLTVFLTEKI